MSNSSTCPTGALPAPAARPASSGERRSRISTDQAPAMTAAPRRASQGASSSPAGSIPASAGDLARQSPGGRPIRRPDVSSQAHHAPNSAAPVQAGAAVSSGRNYKPLTEAEIVERERTVARLKKRGLNITQIAPMIGMTPDGLRQWLYKSAGPRLSASFRLSQRNCMCCREAFMSEGAHNRLCADCRRESHQLSPLESTYGSSGRQVGRRK